MTARLAGAAALGAGVSYAASAGGLRWPRRPGDIPEICGTYRLESPNEDRVSGLVVYEPDGRVSTQLIKRAGAGAPADVLAYQGRWWLHNSSTSYAASYPPHDGTLVEHEVTAATDAALVGKSFVQRYALSRDGRLRTSSVELRDGESQAVSTMHWVRVEAA